MTWWWVSVHAAWRRFDAWLTERDAVDAETATWLGSLSTPEDHTQGPFDPVTKPGRRYQGKHRAVPDEPVRRQA